MLRKKYALLAKERRLNSCELSDPNFQNNSIHNFPALSFHFDKLFLSKLLYSVNLE